MINHCCTFFRCISSWVILRNLEMKEESLQHWNLTLRPGWWQLFWSQWVMIEKHIKTPTYLYLMTSLKEMPSAFREWVNTWCIFIEIIDRNHIAISGGWCLLMGLHFWRHFFNRSHTTKICWVLICFFIIPHILLRNKQLDWLTHLSEAVSLCEKYVLITQMYFFLFVQQNIYLHFSFTWIQTNSPRISKLLLFTITW